MSNFALSSLAISAFRQIREFAELPRFALMRGIRVVLLRNFHGPNRELDLGRAVPESFPGARDVPRGD